MAMTAVELWKLVADMRRAQREYYRTTTPTALAKAKQLEKAVDLALEEILHQGTLFT